MSRHLRLQRTMRNPGRQKHRARNKTRGQRFAAHVGFGRNRAYLVRLLPASALLDIWRHRPR